MSSRPFRLSPASETPTAAEVGIVGLIVAAFTALVAGIVSAAFVFRLFFAAIVFPGLVFLASNYLAVSPYLQGFAFRDLSAVGIALFAFASYFPRASVSATANSK